MNLLAGIVLASALQGFDEAKAIVQIRLPDDRRASGFLVNVAERTFLVSAAHVFSSRCDPADVKGTATVTTSTGSTATVDVTPMVLGCMPRSGGNVDLAVIRVGPALTPSAATRLNSSKTSLLPTDTSLPGILVSGSHKSPRAVEVRTNENQSAAPDFIGLSPSEDTVLSPGDSGSLVLTQQGTAGLYKGLEQGRPVMIPWHVVIGFLETSIEYQETCGEIDFIPSDTWSYSFHWRSPKAQEHVQSLCSAAPDDPLVQAFFSIQEKARFDFPSRSDDESRKALRVAAALRNVEGLLHTIEANGQATAVHLAEVITEVEATIERTQTGGRAIHQRGLLLHSRGMLARAGGEPYRAKHYFGLAVTHLARAQAWEQAAFALRDFNTVSSQLGFNWSSHNALVDAPPGVLELVTAGIVDELPENWPTLLESAKDRWPYSPWTALVLLQIGHAQASESCIGDTVNNDCRDAVSKIAEARSLFKRSARYSLVDMCNDFAEEFGFQLNGFDDRFRDRGNPAR